MDIESIFFEGGLDGAKKILSFSVNTQFFTPSTCLCLCVNMYFRAITSPATTFKGIHARQTCRGGHTLA